MKQRLCKLHKPLSSKASKRKIQRKRAFIPSVYSRKRRRDFKNPICRLPSTLSSRNSKHFALVKLNILTNLKNFMNKCPSKKKKVTSK